jgi:magnesium transporter
MQQVLARTEVPPLLWIDLTNPTREELEAVAREHGLHPHLVRDCLEPGHLPKLEIIAPFTFVIARSYDTTVGVDADTAQEMTRKVAVFSGPGVLITVHRKEAPGLIEVRDQLRRDSQIAHGLVAIAAILDKTVRTYAPPLELAENESSELEESVMTQTDVADALRASSLLKRRVSVMRWMLRRTMDVVQSLKALPGAPVTPLQEVKERAEQLYVVADELVDDVNNLINLQLALASHSTNQVMKLLTVFSVFFLPLTFIVGVYGMNFEHMPELKSHWGYPAVWAVMGATVLGIFLWFRRKGWLG